MAYLKSSDLAMCSDQIPKPERRTQMWSLIYSLDGESVPIDWNESNRWEYLVSIQWTGPDAILQLFKHVIKSILPALIPRVALLKKYIDGTMSAVEIIPGAPK